VAEVELIRNRRALRRCRREFDVPPAQIHIKGSGGGESDVQYLRIYIRTLRQKLESDPEQPSLILTEQGVGYARCLYR
jgi:DNA-binding response OmpR family regulator